MAHINVSELVQRIHGMTHNLDDIHVACVPIDASLLRELERLYADEPHKHMLWKWQFKSRFGRTCHAIIARYQGRLIGFNATMPVLVRDGLTTQEAIWSCDFIVAKEFRGKGIGNRIKEKMLQSFSIPIMSLGISNDALPILIKKGWKQGPLVPVYKRVFRAHNVRELLLLILCQSRLMLSRQRTPTGYQYLYFTNNCLPDSFLIEQLLNGFKQEADCIEVLKDYEYLRWRYAEFPWPTYNTLLVLSEASAPVAILVYRYSSNRELEVTDYIAVSHDPLVVRYALKSLQQRYPKLAAITWSCSHQQLKDSLGRNGFLKKKYGTRFVCYNPHKNVPNATWSLTSGDSDGDFLKVVKKISDNKPGGGGYPLRRMDYRLVRIDEQEFLSSQRNWDELVESAQANPLFMSWHWQSTWWKVWGKKLGLELFIHFIYLDHELVGILPLYRYRQKGLGSWQLQFLGNAWRISPSVRSEYISPIFTNLHRSNLFQFFNNWLASFGISTTAIIPDCTCPEFLNSERAVVRQSDVGYKVDTKGSLDEYLSSLGDQTRLKAFNRLKYLEQQYPDAQWQEVSLKPEAVDAFFKLLNEFHKIRWNKPCFDQYAIKFHKEIIFGDNKIKPLLHQLSVRDEVVSVSYNLLCDGVLYNIQSGYFEDFDKKLSLGTLHFGEILRYCFSEQGISSLDFLAGSGKKSNYKKHFCGSEASFNTYQIYKFAVLVKFRKLAVSLKLTKKIRRKK